MPRFFVDNLSDICQISGEDATHISGALRMKVGENLTLCDKNSMESVGVITSISSKKVTVTLGKINPSQSEPLLKVTLYIAWPKGDKPEFIVQKSVELGVNEIVFVLSSRSISRPDNKSADKKIARLLKVSEQAAQQAHRGIIPNVRGIIPFAEACEDLSRHPLAFLLYEGDCPHLKDVLTFPQRELALFTGCEGGFSSEEVLACKEVGIATVSLGKRILRCETAPIAAIAAIMFANGDLG